MEKAEARARTCYEKAAYLTKDEANRTIHHIRKHRGQNMSAYRCPICRCWHLTTQKAQR